MVQFNIIENGSEYFFYHPITNSYPVVVLQEFLNNYSKWIKEPSYSFAKEFSYHFKNARLTPVKPGDSNSVFPPGHIAPILEYRMDLDKKSITISNKDEISVPFVFKSGHEAECAALDKILQQIYFLGFKINNLSMDSLKLKLLLKVM